MSVPGPALTHVDSTGAARMVDVSDKPASARTAVATGATGGAEAGPAPSAADPGSPQARHQACLEKAGASISEAQKCALLLNGG